MKFACRAPAKASARLKSKVGLRDDWLADGDEAEASHHDHNISLCLSSLQSDSEIQGARGIYSLLEAQKENYGAGAPDNVLRAMTLILVRERE